MEREGFLFRRPNPPNLPETANPQTASPSHSASPSPNRNPLPPPPRPARPQAANVLLTASPASPYGAVAKLSDFGLSRALASDVTHRSTRTFGTVTHCSPELLRSGRASPAADVYAFGIMVGRGAGGGCWAGPLAGLRAPRLALRGCASPAREASAPRAPHPPPQ